VTARSQRAQLFEAARALAAVLADDFYGSVEVHIHTMKKSDKGD